MTGYVSEVKFGYVFISCRLGSIFCHASAMPVDEAGRRYLMLGEKISFDLDKHNGRTVAVNVELLNPREPVDLDSYCEEGTVHNVRNRGEYCFILRPFGGVAMLHWQNVRSCKSKCQYGVKFEYGQMWRYAIEPPLDGDEQRAWRAVDAIEVLLQ